MQTTVRDMKKWFDQFKDDQVVIVDGFVSVNQNVEDLLPAPVHSSEAAYDRAMGIIGRIK
jgi:hypothetical protein